MKVLYVPLSDKDRRSHAAVKAGKFGHGGVQCIATLIEYDAGTIREGADQLPVELSLSVR